MKAKPLELDIDYMGSQDPADQPTAEDFARLSEYLKAQRADNEKLIAEARQAVGPVAKAVRVRRKTAA